MSHEAEDPQQAELAIPGVLSFHRTPSGLAYAEIATPTATAKVFLQGAHLAEWEPIGHEQVLFLSPESDFIAGKAIRGGVPLVFPWFATDAKPDRVDGKPGPSHGFARTQPWTLAFAALAGDDLSLSFTLAPSAISRSMGFDHFRLALQLTIGRKLTLRLTVGNDGPVDLAFEEAFHTYFAVSDVRQVVLHGLEETAYIDKTAGFATLPATHEPLRWPGFSDRIYAGTAAACVLEDPGYQRRITVAKTNSATTVVFNPQKALPDLATDSWPKMLCVETANVGDSSITLASGSTHTMTAEISVESLGA